MYKKYPYLQDSYIYQTDIEREKRSLLNEIDSFLNQRQYVKITLLNWDEEPIKAIEGEISSGSISKVGDSPIRRTAQLTCAVDARSYSVDDGKADFAINKKVFIEIGVKNETPHYPEYPIFWFPEGVFFIGSFSINSSANSSTNITLSLKDKMAMLNGDVGGTLPSTVIFDSMDTQLPNGKYIEKKVLIYNIIQELVHHYGGEDLNRIVIEGVPLRIRRIMQWMGDTPLYQITTAENSDIDTGKPTSEIYRFTTNSNDTEINDDTPMFEKGDDVGYIMDDFVILDELTGAPGESVTSILDKIKNIIGNYEYFYDIFGTFHFREIKNYYVTTQARTLLDEMSENDYLVETNNSRSIYTFDDEKLLTSITINPQYENIKNDYIVEGQTTIADTDITIPIRYHLAIDKKPSILGVDTRTKTRTKINNTDEIDILKEKLDKLIKVHNIDTLELEKLLYNIRIACNYINNKIDLIDTKDKELLKQLQDYLETTYTYEDLKPVIISGYVNLFSEALVYKLYEDSTTIPDLQTFLNNLTPKSSTSLKEINDLKTLKTKKENQYTLIETFINDINTSTTTPIPTNINTPENIEIINKIIDEYDHNNFPINEELYKSGVKQLRLLANEIAQLNIQISILEEQLQDDTVRFYSYQTNLLNLYAFIIQLQQQMQDKLIDLDGPVNEFDTINYGIENNHECLINKNNNSIQWFSHNIEKINDFIKNDDKYSFILNKVPLIKTLNSKNEYTFSKNSLFGQFYDKFIEYHNNDNNNSITKQIQDLQNQINILENEFGFKLQDNPHINDNYYEIYPIEEDEMILYTHPRNNLVCAAYVENVDTLPDVGNFNLIYKNNDEYLYWDGEMYQTVDVLEVYDNTSEENQYYAYDWRTKLYLDGLKGVINGTDKGYYYAELSAFWPQVYNLRTQKFFGEEKNTALDYKTLAVAGNYYLDFLDEIGTSFGEWSVNNIGRRSNIIVKEEINCLFQPEIPNVIILPSKAIDLSSIGKNMANETFRYGSSLESSLTLEELRIEARRNFYPYSQVDSEIYNNLLTGGYRNGAFDQIKYELYLHTRYQKSISLTSIPVLYLEPNNRITINDTTTHTYGDFVIQSINLTLGPGANMSITCNEIAERF